MGLYDIITPENIRNPPTWRAVNFKNILPSNVLFFWTSRFDEYTSDGITVDLSGQHVQKISDDHYVLQPSGIHLEIDFQTMKIYSDTGIRITQPVVSDDEDVADAILDQLRTYLNTLLVKQTGKEVGLVSRLEMPNTMNRAPGNNKSRTLRRNVPYNAKGLISGFLTGKTGSVSAQTNALQQNLGTSLAPRPRKSSRRHRTRRRL